MSIEIGIDNIDLVRKLQIRQKMINLIRINAEHGGLRQRKRIPLTKFVA